MNFQRLLTTISLSFVLASLAQAQGLSCGLVFRSEQASSAHTQTAAAAVLSENDILNRQTRALGNQVVQRGMDEYASNFNGQLFTQILSTPGSHWLDIGGGAGIAALESFYVSSPNWVGDYRTDRKPQLTGQHDVTVVTLEDIFGAIYPDNRNQAIDAFKSTIAQRDRRTQSYLLHRFGNMYEILRNVRTEKEREGKFRYLHSRFFEDIPVEEIKKADLITDFYGAFSYSAEKFEVLRRMGLMLKPAGRIEIKTIEIFVSGRGSSPMTLSEWAKTQSLPGITITDSSITVVQTEGTQEALERLARGMMFVKAEENLPPRFFFSFDQQPN